MARNLYYSVESDPRVVAAKEAIRAFDESEAAKILDSAYESMDWEQSKSHLVNEIEERYELHSINLTRTRNAVMMEMLSKNTND